MKLLHFAQWTPSSHCGVTQKIIEQCEGWAREGACVASVMLCVSGVPDNVQLPDFVTVIAPEQRTGSSLVARYVAKLRLLARVRQVVRDFDPDITYARRFTWAPGYIRAIARKKLVIEVNTNDKVESREYPWAKRILYRVGLWLLSRRADGFVTVTPDLAAPLRKSAKPVSTIGNGISDARFPAEIAGMHRDGREAVFVGTPNQPWHGVDRLILLAEVCPEVTFHVVGPTEMASAPKNVIFHGLLGRADLGQLYGRCSVGLGSLALERVEMSHSSSLKVREYLACGLSVILESVDQDVAELPGVRLVPWGDSWASRAKEALEDLFDQDRVSIREVAMRHCSSDAVEGRRMEFIRGIVETAK